MDIRKDIQDILDKNYGMPSVAIEGYIIHFLKEREDKIEKNINRKEQNES